jgi:hypothetical protein
MPAGPPPTIQQRTFMVRAGECSDVLASMTRLSLESAAIDCSVRIRPEHPQLLLRIAVRKLLLSETLPSR